MKTILVFDTETTGRADFKSSPDAPHQPRLVQLGAILTDDEDHVISEINVLVKPDGFTIPIEASNIHGITTEKAEKFGIKLATALGMFKLFLDRADEIVAHNYDYDKFVMIGEYLRATNDEMVQKIKEFKNYCTMKSSTAICNIPGPWGPKWPKLEEAYKIFFNETFEGAHDAMADVRGCKRIYFHLKSLGEKK